MISIPTNLLAAVAKWAYPLDDRPKIHMVLFTRGEYVATDGHRLVRVPLDYDGPAFGVSRAHLLAAVVAQRAMDSNYDEIEIGPRIDSANHVDLGISLGVVLTVPKSDAAIYPPYEPVMPKRRPGPAPEPFGFNPQFMADVHEVDRASRAHGSAGVRVTAWGGTEDAVLLENAEGIRFVIMPVLL